MYNVVLFGSAVWKKCLQHAGHATWHRVITLIVTDSQMPDLIHDII